MYMFYFIEYWCRSRSIGQNKYYKSKANVENEQCYKKKKFERNIFKTQILVLINHNFEETRNKLRHKYITFCTFKSAIVIKTIRAKMSFRFLASIF